MIASSSDTCVSWSEMHVRAPDDIIICYFSKKVNTPRKTRRKNLRVFSLLRSSFVIRGTILNFCRLEIVARVTIFAEGVYRFIFSFSNFCMALNNSFLLVKV